jgi:nitroreductase
MQWRYAVKKFDPLKKIPDEDWNVLEETLVLTPSSYGLQPWKFFVVTDPDTRAKLPPFTYGQKQVTHASHLVVFAVKKTLEEADIDRYLQRIAEVRGGGVDALSGFKKMMMGTLVPPPEQFDMRHWAANQVYIALGQFMAVAAMMGIDTCPMEGFQPEKYDEILGLTKVGYHSVVLATAGYRAADCKGATLPKVRFKKEDVVVTAKE